MNKLIKYRKIIIVAVFVLSFLLGIYLYTKLKINNMEYIKQNIKNIEYINYKTLLFHIIIIGVSFFLSVMFIGMISLYTYLLFELTTIGFIFSYFISLHKFKGLCYFIAYLCIYKVVILFLFIILIYKYNKIFKNTIIYIKKGVINITTTIYNILLTSFTILIYDLFLLFFGCYLLNIMSFLLK